MKVSELREVIRTVPDDVDIQFELQTKVPDEELKKMSYPWPWNYEVLNYGGFDCGYSSKVLHLFVEKYK